VTFTKLVFVCAILLLAHCFFNSDDQSKIPEHEAKIIRAILMKNSINITEDEPVDSYLYIDSFFHENEPEGHYYIRLPQKEIQFVRLTDDINDLVNISNKFQGICPINGSKAETLIVQTDSIINVRSLEIGFKLRTIPEQIQNLRGRSFVFADNEITAVPEEIMKLSAEPKIFDTVKVFIGNNKIDTSLISDSLDAWLVEHAGAYWKATQRHEE